MSGKAQARFVQAWQQHGLLAKLLWPLSRAFLVAVHLRRWLFQTSWMQSTRVAVPVIVVGNVVVGGVGKTPVAIAVVEHLQSKGLRVGVISRGYGRRTNHSADSDCIEVRPDGSAHDFGDESLLIRRRTGAPVFVAGHRVQAAQALLRAYPDTQVIIADDGLQHYALQRDFEVCVFDDRGVGNGWLMPAGMLREPWPQLPFPIQTKDSLSPQRWVLHTGDHPRFSGFRCVRKLASFAQRADGTHVPLSDFVQQAQDDPTLRLTAVAGIAQPEVFFTQLRQRGIPLAATQSLPDHYDFDSWKREPYCRNVVFCTEKDAVKLWQVDAACWAVPLQVTVDSGLLTALDAALAPRLSLP